MKENLTLLILLFAKVGLYCGFAEFLIFYAAVSAWRARRVPARNQLRRWQVCMYKFPGSAVSPSNLVREVGNQPARNFQEAA